MLFKGHIITLNSQPSILNFKILNSQISILNSQISTYN